MYFDPELAENVTQDDIKETKFGTHLIATQFSSEGDGFGQDYDPDASYEDDTDESVDRYPDEVG